MAEVTTVALVPCVACGKDITPDQQKFASSNGTELHSECSEKTHTFLCVNFDGFGGPACIDQAEVEEFIGGEIEHSGATREDFAVRERTEPWSWFASLHEFDGY